MAYTTEIYLLSQSVSQKFEIKLSAGTVLSEDSKENLFRASPLSTGNLPAIFDVPNVIKASPLSLP